MSKWKKQLRQQEAAAAGTEIRDPGAEIVKVEEVDGQPEAGDQGSAGETETVAGPPASSPLAPPTETVDPYQETAVQGTETASQDPESLGADDAVGAIV